jgi:hypothetical protein
MVRLAHSYRVLESFLVEVVLRLHQVDDRLFVQRVEKVGHGGEFLKDEIRIGLVDGLDGFVMVAFPHQDVDVLGGPRFAPPAADAVRTHQDELDLGAIEKANDIGGYRR